MILNVLISCMYEKDTSIVARSNVQTDCVVVNQCDFDIVEEFDFVNKKGKLCHCKFINTTERGLSRSRNMAINNAWGDICLICDDDEIFNDNGENIILRTYDENPSVDIATFQFSRENKKNNKKYPIKKCKVGIKRILQTSSIEITFRLDRIRENNILFDEKMGSGTGNGAGEENKFLFDCRNKKLNICFFPEYIVKLKDSESKWFRGYDERYFENHGWASRRCLGVLVAPVYIILFILKHNSLFRGCGLSFTKVLKSEFKGFFSKR